MDNKKSVIGAENEFKVNYPNGSLIRFEDLISRIDKPIIKQSEKGFWWDGGYLYEDTNENLRGKKKEKSRLIELCTHPIEAKKGCATVLADHIMYNIALLANISDGLNIGGYRRQYCVSADSFIDDIDIGKAKADMPIHRNIRYTYNGRRSYLFNKFQVDICKTVLKTIGPGLILLFGHRGERSFTLSPHYPGLSQENKIEFDTDLLLEPDQLKAAISFWIGCEKGIERLIKESLLDFSRDDLVKDYRKMQITEVFRRMPFTIKNSKIVPGPLKASLRVDGYEKDIHSFGSKALLDIESGSKKYTMSVRDIIREYFSFFEHDIIQYATKKEISLLRRYIDGKVSFNHRADFFMDASSPRIDKEVMAYLYGKSPAKILRSYELKGMSRLFSDAVKYKRKIVSRKGIEKVIRETVVHKSKSPSPEWDGVCFRFRHITGSKEKVARVYVPRDMHGSYFRLESKDPEYFFNKVKEISPWRW